MSSDMSADDGPARRAADVTAIIEMPIKDLDKTLREHAVLACADQLVKIIDWLGIATRIPSFAMVASHISEAKMLRIFDWIGRQLQVGAHLGMPLVRMPPPATMRDAWVLHRVHVDDVSGAVNLIVRGIYLDWSDAFAEKEVLGGHKADWALRKAFIYPPTEGSEGRRE